MPQYYDSFQPMTPIGQAMSRAQKMSVAGPTPYQRALEAARIERLATQDRKTEMEIAALEADKARRAPGSNRQNTAFSLAMPLPKVNAIASYLETGGEPDPTWMQDDIAKVGRTLSNMRVGTMGKSPNPANIEQGVTRNVERAMMERALADPSFRTGTYGPVMNAKVGRGEIAASTGINTFTGEANTPLAQAVVSARNAQAAQANAAAGLSGARHRQVDKETTTGIRAGAPVIIDDETYGPQFRSPYDAAGEMPGSRPESASTVARNRAATALSDARRREIERTSASGLPKKTRDELLARNSEIDRILSFIDQDLVDASGAGVGALASVLAAADATLGQVTPDQIAPDTQAARQKLREFVQIAKTALVNNPRFPVAEQQVIAKMLPDPDAFFKNPSTAVQDLQSLRALLQRLRLANEDSIGAPQAPAAPDAAAPGATATPAPAAAPAAAPAPAASGAKDYRHLWGGK